MSSHASTELLSAYLDHQLAEPEVRELEAHLESCSQCHVRLEGLRKVVQNLQSLEQLATPLSLEQTVARRIELAEPQESFSDRLEQGLSIFNRQSPILATFGVVIALALFIYLFSYTLHLRQTSTTQVIWEDPPSTSIPTATTPAVGEVREVAGKALAWSEEGIWVEQGVDVAKVARTLNTDSADGTAWLAQHPELAELAALEHSVVLEVDGEVLRLD